MKKSVLASAILLASTASLHVNADTTGSVVASGTISGVTELRNVSLSTAALTLDSTTPQTVGTFTSFSNEVGTFSIEVTTLNGFKLLHSANSAIEIPYIVSVEDDNPIVTTGLGYAVSTGISANPLNYEVLGTSTIQEGNGAVAMQLDAHSFDDTNTVAGDFSDTITITLTGI